MVDVELHYQAGLHLGSILKFLSSCVNKIANLVLVAYRKHSFSGLRIKSNRLIHFSLSHRKIAKLFRRSFEMGLATDELWPPPRCSSLASNGYNPVPTGSNTLAIALDSLQGID